MSEKLQAVFTGLRRGVYAPVSTNGRDEEEEGLVQGPVDEKSSIGRSNFGSFVRPVVQCFLVVGLMAASYTFGSYSARVPTTSTGFIPEIPFKAGAEIFSDDHAWIGPGKEADILWAKEYQIVSDQKFIKIEDPAAFDTPPGQQDSTGLSHYSVSVYHQLHCLTMFRALIYDEPYSSNGNNDKRLNMMAQNKTGEDWWFHLGHCFNYMRQAIRCTVDTTLEYPPHNHTKTTKHKLKRTGNRQCRDISVLDAFVEENKWEKATLSGA